MRRLILLVCALMVLAGCQGQNSQKSVAADAAGGGKFPVYLVGTWKTPSYDWEFTFKPNGTIASIVDEMGGLRITAGQTKTAETLGGKKAIFQPGPWDVQYSSETRELTVEIIMDHIHFEMGENLLEGKCTDIFAGKVSDDGKVWRADWFSFTDYLAHTSEGVIPMKAPDEQSFVETLEFRKVEDAAGAAPSHGDANQ